MIGISGKIVTFILQAVAVILIVFLFSYFDPFNIFNSKKLILKDTPTIVTSIRGIGKLITAEYYGEVIKSSSEIIEFQMDSARDEEKSGLLEMEKIVKNSVDNIQEEGKEYSNRRKFYRAFENQFPNLISNVYYDRFISLGGKQKGQNEKEILFAYYENKLTIDHNAYVISVQKFIDDKYKLTGKEKKQIQKNALIVLGRGSIKAGIDFSNFDASHFKFYPDQNLVRLTYHQPEIISKTINPWFIPALKMKGFEYLFVGKRIEKNPDSEVSVEAIRAIKQSCLDNLETDAKLADILGKARENAEIALGHFLSLLLGKEVRVEIFSHPLDAAMHDIAKSGRITNQDVTYVDSLVGQYAATEFSRMVEFLKELNDSIHQKRFEKPAGLDTLGNWEVLALNLRVSDDGFFNATERDSVNRYLMNTSTLPKDLVYYVMQYPDLTKKIIKEEVNLENLDDSVKKGARQLKSDGMVKLKSDCERLRTMMTAAEIRRCDDIIGQYLLKDNLGEAFNFAMLANSYGFPKSGCETVDQNWEFLKLIKSLEGSKEDSLLTTKTLTSFKPDNRKAIFYFLFYSGEFPSTLEKGPGYWQQLVKLDAGQRQDSLLKANIRDGQTRNMKCLCDFLKQKKMASPACPQQ